MSKFQDSYIYWVLNSKISWVKEKWNNTKGKAFSTVGSRKSQYYLTSICKLCFALFRSRFEPLLSGNNRLNLPTQFAGSSLWPLDPHPPYSLYPCRFFLSSSFSILPIPFIFFGWRTHASVRNYESRRKCARLENCSLFSADRWAWRVCSFISTLRVSSFDTALQPWRITKLSPRKTNPEEYLSLSPHKTVVLNVIDTVTC